MCFVVPAYCGIFAVWHNTRTTYLYIYARIYKHTAALRAAIQEVSCHVGGVQHIECRAQHLLFRHAGAHPADSVRDGRRRPRDYPHAVGLVKREGGGVEQRRLLRHMAHRRGGSHLYAALHRAVPLVRHLPQDRRVFPLLCHHHPHTHGCGARHPQHAVCENHVAPARLLL